MVTITTSLKITVATITASLIKGNYGNHDYKLKDN